MLLRPCAVTRPTKSPMSTMAHGRLRKQEARDPVDRVRNRDGGRDPRVRIRRPAPSPERSPTHPDPERSGSYSVPSASARLAWIKPAGFSVGWTIAARSLLVHEPPLVRTHDADVGIEEVEAHRHRDGLV